MTAKPCTCTDCQRDRILQRIKYIYDNVDHANEAASHREVSALALELADVVEQENSKRRLN
jgi:hypothetical protein